MQTTDIFFHNLCCCEYFSDIFSPRRSKFLILWWLFSYRLEPNLQSIISFYCEAQMFVFPAFFSSLVFLGYFYVPSSVETWQRWSENMRGCSWRTVNQLQPASHWTCKVAAMFCCEWLKVEHASSRLWAELCAACSMHGSVIWAASSGTLALWWAFEVLRRFRLKLLKAYLVESKPEWGGVQRLLWQ